MPDAGTPLNNDEIEVACDLLRFVKANGALSDDANALWERLQPIRHGDYWGRAATTLSRTEAAAVIAAGQFTDSLVPLDPGEAALIRRLEQSTQPQHHE